VARRKPDPVADYAGQVTKGRIPAGELLIMACERHLKDLKTAKMRGLFFDEEAAGHAIEFFSFLRFWEGEWAGCVFEPEPWQKFIIGSLFGWKRTTDGARRFRTGYIEVPRKNGKSPLIAGIGLYMFVADNEPGAQVYSAATKRDQAKIVWNHAARMVKRSPDLSKRIQTYWGKGNMNIVEAESKFEPLGADADTMDGLNIHAALVDELHAHKTRAVWDVLETATSSRRQPLQLGITTAGVDQTSVCFENHSYGEMILKGTVEDDTYFVFISTIDEGDKENWDDPKVWAKANPNLGISVKLDDLQRKCNKAKELPTAQNAFLRLHLNVWTQQVNRWIPLELWDKNAGIVVEVELKGRTCYGGLDLSSVDDLTAWALVFPRDGDPEELDILVRCWCPEARLHDRQNRYRDQYKAWVKAGWLRTTPGNAIDYSFIKAQVMEDAQVFNLVDLNIDRLFQAHQLATELQEEGLKVAPMGQGYLSMTTPTKEFQRRLLIRKLHHGGNPVLRWMADAVAVREDPAGNLKTDKAASQGKIDGIVAIIMALDRAMRHEKPKKSIYEDPNRKVFAF
jgi:phage terminase large subunit-like protein